MASGNFDEPLLPPPSAPPPPVPTRSFRLPAQYYSAPLTDVRPIFPRWVPMGCGIASAVFLLLLFIAGAVASGAGFGRVFDLVIGATLGELRPMMAADVQKSSRDHFESEVSRMREGLREGRVPITRVQPFLKSMQTAITDKTVTEQELDQLTRAATEATATPAKR